MVFAHVTCFNVNKSCRVVHRQYLCVLYDSHTEQRLFPEQHLPDGLCNWGTKRFQWDINWILIYYPYKLRFSRFKFRRSIMGSTCVVVNSSVNPDVVFSVTSNASSYVSGYIYYIAFIIRSKEVFITVRQNKHFSCSVSCCFYLHQLIRRCDGRVNEELWHKLFKVRDTAQRSMSACFVVLYQLIHFFITFGSETLMLFVSYPAICLQQQSSWFWSWLAGISSGTPYVTIQMVLDLLVVCPGRWKDKVEQKGER